MVNEKIFLILIIIISVIAAISLSKKPICEKIYYEIDSELKAANYCANDSDCKPLPLGGKYAEFGCYHYINKNIDGEELYKKMDDYWNRCSQIINDCDTAPEAVCVNEECVSKE